MILPCEVGVKTVLPAVKAIMARIMVKKHELTEKQTADLLGLSQSAVSRYVGRERGNNLPIEDVGEIVALIEQMVISLMKEPEDKNRILELFCQACATIREKGIMCQSCQKQMPQEWAKTCFFCR